MNPLLLLLGAIAIPKLIGAKKTSERLEFFPKNIHLKEGKFFLYVDVLNPTNNSLKVDSFFGGVFIGDTKVGSIEMGTPITYAANKRTEEKFPIIPIGTGLAKAIVEIIKGKGSGLIFKVVGVARSMGFNNPINEELKLS